jgi:glycosyltransferase involved in cell wall biosynthesis
MQKRGRLTIELVEHSPGAPLTGIGRYARELCRHLPPLVDARLTTQINPPLTGRLTFLHYMPIGVHGHQDGNIVHFMEDVGCAQMLWRPLRPAIATSHDLGMLVWPPEARMHRAFDRVMLRLSYLGLKRMDAVVTISQFSRQALIERLRIPAERVFAIYSGNDHALFRPIAGARAALVRRYGLPDRPGDRYLLYVGSELPRKNMATLLRMLRRLPGNMYLLKVGLAGPKRFREQTNRLIAELGLGGRVLFMEQVPEDELPLWYSAADVYLCASFLEGFGHPVVEAMACGAPVICSDCSSLREVAGDAAIRLPPADDRAFAEAVERVLGDRSLAEQMAARGLRQAATFTWRQTAEAVSHVYARVAGADAANHAAYQPDAKIEGV